MINDIVLKNCGNILKTGTILILSTLINQVLRESSNQTIGEITKDIRKIKTNYQDKKNLQQSF